MDIKRASFISENMSAEIYNEIDASYGLAYAIRNHIYDTIFKLNYKLKNKQKMTKIFIFIKFVFILVTLWHVLGPYIGVAT